MARFAVEVRTLEARPDLRPADVLTITEAAELLGVSLGAARDLLNREREPLARVIDQDEGNPTKRTRFLKAEIEAERKRRRGRRSDERLSR